MKVGVGRALPRLGLLDSPAEERFDAPRLTTVPPYDSELLSFGGCSDAGGVAASMLAFICS